MSVPAQIHDCSTCGLCCVAPTPKATSYVDANDYKGPRPEHWTRFSERSYGSVMRQRRDGRCKALLGTVGERCSCAIYADRPQVCGDYEPGDAPCLAVRAGWGQPDGPRSAVPVPPSWRASRPTAAPQPPDDAGHGSQTGAPGGDL